MKFKVVEGFIKIDNSADSANLLVPGEYSTSKGILNLIKSAKIASNSTIFRFLEFTRLVKASEASIVLNSLLMLFIFNPPPCTSSYADCS
jgi:hypothetical protein